MPVFQSVGEGDARRYEIGYTFLLKGNLNCTIPRWDRNGYKAFCDEISKL